MDYFDIVKLWEDGEIDKVPTYKFEPVKKEHEMVKDVTKKTKEEQIELAEMFSETSAEYKKLLLCLWENGIETLAGCSGIPQVHNDETDKPYISILVNPKRKNFFKAFSHRLLDCCMDGSTIHHFRQTFISGAVISIYAGTPNGSRMPKENCEEFFRTIRKLLALK